VARITIRGDEHVVRVVGKKAQDIPLALRLASEAAAEKVKEGVVDYAPNPHNRGPHGRSEQQGAGITTSVDRLFRFAGRAKGGLLATNQTFIVKVNVKDPSVAAFTEWGTGIYAQHERGGAHTPWVIDAAKYGKKALGPLKGPGGIPLLNAKGNRLFAKKVTIPGAKATPFIADGVESVHQEVDEIYNAAIDEVI
jgi:hypothetical protein